MLRHCRLKVADLLLGCVSESDEWRCVVLVKRELSDRGPATEQNLTYRRFHSYPSRSELVRPDR